LDSNSSSRPLPSLPLSDLLFVALENMCVLSHSDGFAMEISIYNLLRT
jgi:hypothetical protein